MIMIMIMIMIIRLSLLVMVIGLSGVRFGLQSLRVKNKIGQSWTTRSPITNLL